MKRPNSNGANGKAKGGKVAAADDFVRAEVVTLQLTRPDSDSVAVEHAWPTIIACADEESLLRDMQALAAKYAARFKQAVNAQQNAADGVLNRTGMERPRATRTRSASARSKPPAELESLSTLNTTVPGNWSGR